MVPFSLPIMGRGLSRMRFGGYKVNGGEIGAVSAGIAGQNSVAPYCRMRADEEIGQDPFAPTAGATVKPEGRSSGECSRPRQILAAEFILRQQSIDFVHVVVPNGKFGIDDR